MDLRNLTVEESLMLEEEEAKASINIGRRPDASAFPSADCGELVELSSAKRGTSRRAEFHIRSNEKAS